VGEGLRDGPVLVHEADHGLDHEPGLPVLPDVPADGDALRAGLQRGVHVGEHPRQDLRLLPAENHDGNGAALNYLAGRKGSHVPRFSATQLISIDI